MGLLVGLQRQRTDARLAGFRTFPLVALLGALCGLLAQGFGGWVVAGGLAALALVIVGGSFPLLKAGGGGPGVTTEVSMLVMFAVGALLIAGSIAVCAAVSGAVAVLLHLKPQMHRFAAAIGDRDFAAVMQFVLIFLVVLPLLPNRRYGPFMVLNPFRIWLMVVLIVGISLSGYIVYKFLGARAGAWASGIIGGLISSTATTVGVSRRAREQPGAPEPACFIILTASAIVFVRVGILIAVTAPRLLGAAIPFLATMFGVLSSLAWMNLRSRAGRLDSIPAPRNPTELKPALVFGALYALVLVAVEAANVYLGRGGLYAAAAASGLTDMDAITLSVTQLADSTRIPPGTAWRLLLVASMANLAFKAAVVGVLAGRRLFRRIAASLGVAAIAGGALFALMPD
jgi:uncharacterized membrane protein (DUF4010 family)